MAVFNKYNKFIMHGMHKEHDLETDTLMIALSQGTVPLATWAILGDVVGEIAYDNVSTSPTGGRVVGNTGVFDSSEDTTPGTYKLTLPDMTILAGPAVIPTFRYIHLYNSSTPGVVNGLIGYIDYGSDLDLGIGESLVVDFDDVLGLFTVT